MIHELIVSPKGLGCTCGTFNFVMREHNFIVARVHHQAHVDATNILERNAA